MQLASSGSLAARRHHSATAEPTAVTRLRPTKSFVNVEGVFGVQVVLRLRNHRRTLRAGAALRAVAGTDRGINSAKPRRGLGAKARVRAIIPESAEGAMRRPQALKGLGLFDRFEGMPERKSSSGLGSAAVFGRALTMHWASRHAPPLAHPEHHVETALLRLVEALVKRLRGIGDTPERCRASAQPVRTIA